MDIRANGDENDHVGLAALEPVDGGDDYGCRREEEIAQEVGLPGVWGEDGDGRGGVGVGVGAGIGGRRRWDGGEREGEEEGADFLA